MADKTRTARLDWEDLRYYVALARHGSLSATARALRVNHATVARRIAGLEASLSRALFERRADGYVLTAEGKAVLDQAKAMDEAALGVLNRLDRGTELAGLVRLTTARVLADGFLVRRLAPLYRRHPGLDLELITEARVLSLSRREADMALRMGRPQDSELVGQRVAKIGFAFYAAPAYRKSLAAGTAPLLIGYDEGSGFLAEATWLDRKFGDHRFAFRTNSQTAQADAARAGFGVALLPRYLAANDPGLVQVALGNTPPDRDLWLLIRPDLRKVPRIRAVADYLVDLFRRERLVMSGR